MANSFAALDITTTFSFGITNNLSSVKGIHGDNTESSFTPSLVILGVVFNSNGLCILKKW